MVKINISNQLILVKKLGRPFRTDKRNCFNCDSSNTHINKKGVECWYKHEDNYLCQKCKFKLIYSPKQHAINNPRQMYFKGKQIILKERILTGKCSECGKEGYTQIHHIKYHEDDPLKDTIELCASCHTYESWRLGQIRNKKVEVNES